LSQLPQHQTIEGHEWREAMSQALVCYVCVIERTGDHSVSYRRQRRDVAAYLLGFPREFFASQAKPEVLLLGTAQARNS
jgi:hypothetical protein